MVWPPVSHGKPSVQLYSGSFTSRTSQLPGLFVDPQTQGPRERRFLTSEATLFLTRGAMCVSQIGYYKGSVVAMDAYLATAGLPSVADAGPKLIISAAPSA